MAIAAVQMTATVAVAADAEHGQQLAKRWCATVTLSIAIEDRQALTFLRSLPLPASPISHPKSSHLFCLSGIHRCRVFPLRRREAVDVAAYIGSLGAYPPMRAGARS